jgi:hypothetical protein
MSQVNTTIQPNIQGELNFKGHSFFILYPNSGKKIEELLEYSVLLIDATHATFASFTIQRLRGFNNPKMYLKPIFFLAPTQDLGNYINSLIDGSVFNLNQLDSIVPRIEEILTKRNQLQAVDPGSYEAKLITKMLTFAYTRGRNKIEPIPYNFSGINYSYPGISCNFEHLEESKVFDIFDLAEEEGLVKGEFYDKTHYCNQCNHGSLNYRSVCPKCGSSNSDTQDIVHHFPCGYVGPINDFKNELDDFLNCPKCDKTLRHIGVDYDKPSILHFCKKCDNRFQDFDVKAKCLHCEFDNELEVLIEKDIKTYYITNKGENAAIFGYLSSQREMDEIKGTVKFDFFSLMVKYEVERIRIVERNVNIAMLYLQDANVIFSNVGRDRRNVLIEEIIDTIKQFIRPYDLISFKTSSIIVLTINDVSLDNASLLLMEIVDLLQKLLKNNVSQLDIKLQNRIKALNPKIGYKNQIDELIEGYH